MFCFWYLLANNGECSEDGEATCALVLVALGIAGESSLKWCWLLGEASWAARVAVASVQKILISNPPVEKSRRCAKLCKSL